jgi:hypothetical protein
MVLVVVVVVSSGASRVEWAASSTLARCCIPRGGVMAHFQVAACMPVHHTFF